VKTEVAIVGGGPGGSAAAMFLSQIGLRVVLIEKTESPRYHIGESLTGECGNCLRALGLEEEMTGRRHPVKYGVTVYGPGGKNAFWVPVKGWHPESGLFDSHTWSVRRSDFDHMLFTEAAARDVSVMQGDAVAPLLNGDAVRGVRVRTSGGTVEDIESEVLVDASGQTTFLSNAGMIGEKVRGNYDRQVAIFSQVAGAIRDPGAASGNTLIFHRENHSLLGVHIIGEGASELLHVGQAVMALGGTIEYFVDTVFNYPTLAECYKVAAFNGLNRVSKLD